MLLYGAGGYGKVVFRMLSELGSQVGTIFDDQSPRTFLNMQTRQYDPAIFPGQQLVVTIGDNRARRMVAAKIAHPFGKVIHQSALIDSSVAIGAGSVVLHRAVIQSEAQIGQHVIVNTGAIIEHECQLGDFVHAAPGATLCGNVRVGANTLLGAGCLILPNIAIGENCIIGAGSVVTMHLPDNTIVAGNPARILHS